MEIASDEYIAGPTSVAQILPRYRDQLSSQPLRTYTLTETLAEKLTCVMQRLQCRDLYDIRRISDAADVSLTMFVLCSSRRLFT